MKTKIKLLCLLVCSMFSVTSFAALHIVTQAEALIIAQRQFQGKDVDYFILQDNSTTAWTVFVDAEPMKGWEHECYILTIPKAITTSVDMAVPSSTINRKLPPSGNFVPLSVKNRL
ncbi:MAG: PepSY domain-containing protein [Muribaculaceae bacterium]|nr:PepSY domain-containing protein [Muribaculaceae bacterium]